MTEVTEADIGADFWSTTEAVRAEFNLEVGNQEPDFEDRIRQATDRIQAEWAEATGKKLKPKKLPDDPDDLLRDATAYMAASLAHLAYATNVSGSNNGDQRHVFLEDAAMDAVEAWKKTVDLDPSSEESGEPSEDLTGFSGVIGGDRRSPISREDRDGY